MDSVRRTWPEGERFDPTDYTEFRYDGVEWSSGSPDVTSHYTLVGRLDVADISFAEKVTLPAAIRHEGATQPTVRLLWLAQGLSYYKAAAPNTITVPSGLTDAEREFLTKLIAGGLGEYAYRNNLASALTPQIIAPRLGRTPAPPLVDSDAPPLVAVGGGKDSVVSIETCKQARLNPVLYSMNSYPAIDRCVAASGCDYMTAERRIDPLLFALNRAGARNGHVPITAVTSLVGLLASHALETGPVIMSNEASANYGNLTWEGHEINHQWSKSLDFENLLRATLSDSQPGQTPYFSLLRPLSELQIAGRFAQYPQYFHAFTSCNRSFALDIERRATHWCCQCPKCLFVYLILAAYLPPATLASIFGRDIMDEPSNEPGLAEILGYTGHKPFECVGDEAEARQALRMVIAQPEWRSSRLVDSLSHQLNDFTDLEPVSSDDLTANIPPRYLAALELS